MQAAILHAFGTPLSIEEIILRPPGRGEVAVRIDACAICHSDIAYMDGAYGGTLPMVLGHEAAGHVTATGPGVTGIATGDAVLVTLIRACGTCPACAANAPTSCDNAYAATVSPISGTAGPVSQGMATGAFAEAVVVDQSQCVALPEDIDPSVACLLSCGVITGFGAVTNTAKLQPGESCAVIGAGGVGLNTIQAAALSGASTVIALDLSDEKLARARTFGATMGLRADDPAADSLLREATGGRGVDYVFVTVGVPRVFETATTLLAPGGAMVMVGLPSVDTRVSYSPTAIAAMNQRLLGSRMGQTVLKRDIPALIELYRDGRLQLDSLVTARYPLSQINAAIDAARQGKAVRNVIVF
ncbi:Zn-dependent alcohol dehydrogenase [Algicella marina]|uniref:Zinc-binding dehydrogenase n=1 Tax=Algicella marina TaxID=2683284 RepID=A0A6P1SWR8_9RHOB|nr:Zn-dependent alcohol dehydrogenase [Algicella marina]QHQ33965.1 zinc-binding dehydrogenase [Algicella marina]